MIFHDHHVVTQSRSSDGLSFLKRGVSKTNHLFIVSVCLVVQLLAISSFGIGSTVSLGETEALSVLSRNAPAVARAIVADPVLRSVVGVEKWPQALKRLAEFSKNTNTDCREALRIIGDSMPRVKSRVGKIQLDGVAAEWGGAIPPADYVLPRREAVKDLWGAGAAAVVRQDHLHLMLGLANAAQYFGQPDGEVRVTLDCKEDQAWDVCLSISASRGRWVVKQLPLGGNGAALKSISAVTGVLGAVAEVALDIREFVPLTMAKPVWTLMLEVKGKGPKGNPQWLRTKELSVFNEDAKEGVAAGPYVRTFLCLCADKPVDDFGLTAAAIAIMSATLYENSDEDVRRKLRADNAEFLELARSIDAWQSQTGTEHRMKKYPLEAQLAWAARIWHNYGHLETSREPGSKNNLENYYWVSTSVDTYRKLQATAIREGLTNTSLTKCSEALDRWVKAKQKYSYPVGYYKNKAKKEGADSPLANKYEEREEQSKEVLANADVVGTYRGKPVSEFRLHHSELLLQQIEKRGRTLGSCQHHTHMCMDFMRALGIAPLNFAADASRSDLLNHNWPARYDPAQQLWLAYQPGRAGTDWWFFSVRRPPVFSCATAAEHMPTNKQYQGPRPPPLFFSREVQGSQVKATSQTGIPTKEIREWMLTPCF